MRHMCAQHFALLCLHVYLVFRDARVSRELLFLFLEKKEVPDTDLPRLQDSELVKQRGRKQKHVSCYFHFRVKSYFLKKRALASDFV